MAREMKEEEEEEDYCWIIRFARSARGADSLHYPWSLGG